MNRETAKELLAHKQMATLNQNQKRDCLEEYWFYSNEEHLRDDVANGNLPQLDNAAIEQIIQTDAPQLPIADNLEPLILNHLVYQLDKVQNEFIEQKLRSFNINEEVTGPLEPAGLCPCCNYYSIDYGEAGLWDVCPVCLWENGGDGANNLPIETAKANFEKFGAIEEELQSDVDPEGPIKYKRHNPS